MSCSFTTRSCYHLPGSPAAAAAAESHDKHLATRLFISNEDTLPGCIAVCLTANHKVTKTSVQRFSTTGSPSYEHFAAHHIGGVVCMVKFLATFCDLSQGQELYYFRDRSSSRPQAVLNLSGAKVTTLKPSQVNKPPTGAYQHVFEVQLDPDSAAHHDYDEYLLAAPSAAIQVIKVESWYLQNYISGSDSAL